MKKVVISHSAEETLELGRQLGAAASPGDVYALYGDLGSGKTVLAKGIALGLDINDDITSPTFTLLEVYPSPLPLYHFDLYRIDDPGEFDDLGFEEYWEGTGVSVIEWAERAGGALPDEAVSIKLEYINGTSRKITIEHSDH